MLIFAGLGNPGPQYARNRHNIGFMAVDAIARAHGFPAFRRKFQGAASEGLIAGARVLLLKPSTYMNDSGRAVGEALRYHKGGIGDVTVFHDELDLAPGKLRVKTGGGNAGHNGLRSISQCVGNDFVRVRIGIGHPGHKDAVSGYVLHDFSKTERVWLEPLLDAMADAGGLLLAGTPDAFLKAIAKATGGEEPKPEAKHTVKAGTVTPAPTTHRPAGAHPAGERAGKKATALDENLRKWMAKKDGSGE